MSKKIDEKTIKKLANLAKIDLTDEEVQVFTDQIGGIMEHVDKLNEIDTDGIEFRSHVDLENVMREDEVDPDVKISNENAVGQTDNSNGYIVVPKVIN